jgi:glycosyltransferase involved in cell wall biosynthesis
MFSKCDSRASVVMVSSIDDFFSGGGVSLFNSTLALSRVHELEVKLTNRGTLYDALNKAGIKVSIIREYGKLDLFYGFRILLSILKLDKKKSIIITHTERTSVLVNPLLFLFRFKLATVLHRSIASGSPWNGKIRSFIFLHAENLILKYFTDIVYCVSDNLAEELVIKRHLDKNKVAVLCNYIDLHTIKLRHQLTSVVKKEDSFKQYPNNNHYNIVSLIRNNSVKGADFFNSRAFERLVMHIKNIIKKDLYLYLVGPCTSDSYYKECKNICNNFGVYLMITGVVKNVNDFLEVTDLYIQPSRDEAFGLGAIEATFYECSVITSNIDIFSKTLANYSIHLPIISHYDDWHVDLSQLSASLVAGRRNGKVMGASYDGWIKYNHDSNVHLEQFNASLVRLFE